VPELPRSTSMA